MSIKSTSSKVYTVIRKLGKQCTQINKVQGLCVLSQQSGETFLLHLRSLAFSFLAPLLLSLCPGKTDLLILRNKTKEEEDKRAASLTVRFERTKSDFKLNRVCLD